MAEEHNEELDSSGEEVSLTMTPKSEAEEETSAIESGLGESATQEEVAEPEEQVAEVVIREGDIFAYVNNVIAVCILSISRSTSIGKMYKVRVFASVLTSIEVSEEQLLSFIQSEGLHKFDTYRDQLEAVAQKIILQKGQVFTREGVFFVEILSEVLWHIDEYGEPTTVVGTRSANEVVAFRSVVDVVASVYGFTDQFPEQN